MKLGLKPFTPRASDLLFHKYLTGEPLPKHPAIIGHEDMVKQPWGMLGNDRFGDCVWAGAAHETMLFNAMAGKTVQFSEDSVLSDYSAVTGFNRNDPNSDQGTDMREAADYRRKVGVIDANGVRHKVGAYVFIRTDSYEDFLDAVWLFGAVGLGIEVPASAMSQFRAGQPWSVVPGSPIEGGHYVPIVADRAMPIVLTWGKAQPMMARFWRKYCTAAVAYISEEMLTGGKTLDGFDLDQLNKDLALLNAD